MNETTHFLALCLSFLRTEGKGTRLLRCSDGELRGTPTTGLLCLAGLLGLGGLDVSSRDQLVPINADISPVNSDRFVLRLDLRGRLETWIGDVQDGSCTRLPENISYDTEPGLIGHDLLYDQFGEAGAQLRAYSFSGRELRNVGEPLFSGRHLIERTSVLGLSNALVEVVVPETGLGRALSGKSTDSVSKRPAGIVLEDHGWLVWEAFAPHLPRRYLAPASENTRVWISPDAQSYLTLQDQTLQRGVTRLSPESPTPTQSLTVDLTCLVGARHFGCSVSPFSGLLIAVDSSMRAMWLERRPHGLFFVSWEQGEPRSTLLAAESFSLSETEVPILTGVSSSGVALVQIRESLIWIEARTARILGQAQRARPGFRRRHIAPDGRSVLDAATVRGSTFRQDVVHMSGERNTVLEHASGAQTYLVWLGEDKLVRFASDRVHVYDGRGQKRGELCVR